MSGFSSHKRIEIFTGHFGSGKTEVAVNYTLQKMREGKKCAIVDLDIVNPFFRTSDAKNILEGQGIKVVTPIYAGTHIDIPALPADINALFENKDYHIIFDVGGDDVGARALAVYLDDFSQEPYEMYCVVNIRRPDTDSWEKIKDMVLAIEYSSHLKVTALVNNTNLQKQTTLQDLQAGGDVIDKAARELGIPVAFTSGDMELLQQIDNKLDGNLLYLERKILLPWEE